MTITPAPTNNDDTITLSGTHNGNVLLLDGDDTITSSGTVTLNGNLSGGAGSDTFNLTNVTINGRLSGNSDGTIDPFDDAATSGASGAINTFNLTDVTIQGAGGGDLIGSRGIDILNLSGNIVVQDDIDLGEANDVIDLGLTGSLTADVVLLGSDDDTFIFDGIAGTGTLSINELVTGNGSDTVVLRGATLGRLDIGNTQSGAGGDAGASDLVTLEDVTITDRFEMSNANNTVTLQGDIDINLWSLGDGADFGGIDFTNLDTLTVDTWLLGADETIINYDPVALGIVDDISTLSLGRGGNTATISNTEIDILGYSSNFSQPNNNTGAGDINDLTLDNVTITDRLFGSQGQDTFTITGTFQNDGFLRMGDGDDSIDLSGVTTSTSTGSFIALENGNDSLIGSFIGDSVLGGSGDDSLFGGGGNDTLDGGNDNDTLSGGDGDNTVTGGDGDDQFIYTVGENLNITDFNTGSTNVGNGDNSDNDFIDLAPFYTDSNELRGDLADDGILNQSNTGSADYSDNTSLGGGSITGLDAPLSSVTGEALTELTGVTFVCFNLGTLIDTPRGPRPIETLRVGDDVSTADGPATLRWIGKRAFTASELQANAKLQPVRIMAGALGAGLPSRDLIVSRQHRFLLRSRIAERMFDAQEVLVPAVRLTRLPGIFVDAELEQVEYFHLLFDKHEVIFAENAPTESLFTGPEALQAVSPECRDEILTIFPEITRLDYAPEPARFIPQGKQQMRLIARHAKNDKPLLG